MVGEPPGTFAVPLIPSGRVMDNHHSGMGALPERPRVVGVNGITLVSLHGDGFRLHTFIIVGLVHSTLLVWFGFMFDVSAHHLIQNLWYVQQFCVIKARIAYKNR